MKYTKLRTIKNLAGKTVCRVDDATQTVEIVAKGQRTLIRFDHGHTFTKNEVMQQPLLHQSSF